MPKPSLVQTFGDGATQTSEELVIKKSSLAKVGLTPKADNSAESLLLSIVLQAKLVLTPEALDGNPDQSISVEDSFEVLTPRNNSTARQKTINLNLFKQEPVINVDPDDY